MKNQREISIIDFIGSEIDAAEEKNHFGLARSYRSLQRSVVNYTQELSITAHFLRDIDVRFVSGYEAWLRQRGVTLNSSSFYMRSFHAIFMRGIRNGLVNDNPFREVYKGVARTRKRSLSIMELQKVIRLDISSTLRAQGRIRLIRYIAKIEEARDMFVFSFCGRGIPFVDIAYLKKEMLRDGVIEYERQKTGQRVSFKVEPLMKDIIDRYQAGGSPYLFPFISSNEPAIAYKQYRSSLLRINRYLRLISDLIGEGIKLSTYVSRHTWASLAYHNGMSVQEISQAMGHDSISTTMIYLRSLEWEKIDKENAQLLAKIFNKK